MDYRFLAGFGIVVLFVYTQGFFKPEYFSISFTVSIISFLLISYIANQNHKYITDCYDGLRKSVRDDKILEYKIPEMCTFDFLYYKKKFND